MIVTVQCCKHSLVTLKVTWSALVALVTRTSLGEWALQFDQCRNALQKLLRNSAG